jgi:hypothetical protein
MNKFLMPFYIILGSGALVIFATIFTGFIDKCLEQRRKEQHPEYFKYYNAAMKICFDASEKVNHEASYIKYHFDLITEGLRDGECTEEYARKRLNELSDRHIEITNWFKEQRADADELFRAADFYAKENNLLWGVLY